MKPWLTLRQEFVLARLYLEYGWSAPRIAFACKVGRRAVESGLRRRGVELRPNAIPETWKRRFRDGMTDQAAFEWFCEAGQPYRELDDPNAASKEITVESGERVLVFRNRRCQHCQALNHFTTKCSACGTPFDAQAAA